MLWGALISVWAAMLRLGVRLIFLWLRGGCRGFWWRRRGWLGAFLDWGAWLGRHYSSSASFVCGFFDESSDLVGGGGAFFAPLVGRSSSQSSRSSGARGGSACTRLFPWVLCRIPSPHFAAIRRRRLFSARRPFKVSRSDLMRLQGPHNSMWLELMQIQAAVVPQDAVHLHQAGAEPVEKCGHIVAGGGARPRSPARWRRGCWRWRGSRGPC